MAEPTAILVVNGEPVAHSSEGCFALYDVLFEMYGDLADDRWVGTVRTPEQIDAWCSLDSGTITPAVTFYRASSLNEKVDFHIYIDPFYVSQYAPDEVEMIAEYCRKHDICYKE